MDFLLVLMDMKQNIIRKISGVSSMVKSILWKYDSELGWAYFCPKCKLFLCSGKGPCKSCGQEIDWKNQVEYKGRVKWS